MSDINKIKEKIIFKIEELRNFCSELEENNNLYFRKYNTLNEIWNEIELLKLKVFILNTIDKINLEYLQNGENLITETEINSSSDIENDKIVIKSIQLPLPGSKYFALEIDSNGCLSFALRKKLYYNSDFIRLFNSNIGFESWNISYTNNFINNLLWKSLIEFEFAFNTSKEENKNLIFKRPIDEFFDINKKEDVRTLSYDGIVETGLFNLFKILFNKNSKEHLCWEKVISTLDTYFEIIGDITRGK